MTICLIETSQIILFPAMPEGAHLLLVLFFAPSSDGNAKKQIKSMSHCTVLSSSTAVFYSTAVLLPSQVFLLRNPLAFPEQRAPLG